MAPFFTRIHIVNDDRNFHIRSGSLQTPDRLERIGSLDIFILIVFQLVIQYYCFNFRLLSARENFPFIAGSYTPSECRHSFVYRNPERWLIMGHSATDRNAQHCKQSWFSRWGVAASPGWVIYTRTYVIASISPAWLLWPLLLWFASPPRTPQLSNL